MHSHSLHLVLLMILSALTPGKKVIFSLFVQICNLIHNLHYLSIIRALADNILKFSSSIIFVSKRWETFNVQFRDMYHTGFFWKFDIYMTLYLIHKATFFSAPFWIKFGGLEESHQLYQLVPPVMDSLIWFCLKSSQEKIPWKHTNAWICVFTEFLNV